MKQFQVLRALLSVVAIIMVVTIVSINPAYAQYTVNESKADATQIQYSTEELESLRSKMLELLDTVQEFSGTIIPNDAHSAERLQAARKQLEQFTLKDLNALRASINPSKMNKNLEQARATLNEFKPSLEAYNNKHSRNFATGGDKEWSNIAPNSPLPGVEPPDAVCQALVGSGRPSSAAVIAADAVYFAAKILDIALNRGCNQVFVAGAVVLGAGVVAGGNTSLACIVSDGILFAAEQVRDKIASCDDDFTKRSVDVAVRRLETIHTDLEDSVANDNANKNTIIANDNANKGMIIANDNANLLTITGAIDTGTTTVTTAVSDGTTLIITNANTNRNTIIANDNTNKDTIIANDNSNTANLLADATANKIELIRLQIAADLASTDGSVLVGAFMLPAVQGGYLELVRTVVVQAITNLAGSSTSQANSLLAEGDSYKNAGNYKNAYASYRKAYKVAVK